MLGSYTPAERPRIAPPSLGRRVQIQFLFPRIGLRDNQADRVLIQSFEAAFALQILQMTHDRLRHKMPL